LADSSGVVIGTAASAILDLNYTGTDTVAALTISGVAKAAGIWGSSTSGAPNTDPKITGTGTLTVVVADPYTAWIESFTPNALLPDAASKLPNADPDNDGISNLLEFTLGGGNPVVSSQAILPTQTTVGADQVLSYKRNDESEAPATTQFGQWSTDLGSWTDVTPVLVNENGTLPDDMTVTVPNSNAVAGKLFLRLKVVK
jgi:hypothetical protein